MRSKFKRYVALKVYALRAMQEDVTTRNARFFLMQEIINRAFAIIRVH